MANKRKTPDVKKRPGKVIGIVPSAGTGKRLAMKEDKPFILIKGVPILIRTIQAILRSKEIDGIIVAVNPEREDDVKRLMLKFKLPKTVTLVHGGETRFYSVRNALRSIKGGCDIVVIHDAARPGIDAKSIGECIACARERGSAILAIPESDTVKLVGEDMSIRRTLDRSVIYRAQTPQVFRYELIRDLYERSDGTGITDDASLVEAAGGRVRIVIGTRRNMKITTPEDLVIAEALICE